MPTRAGQRGDDAQVRAALAAAEDFLQSRGAQFTPIRRAVLRLLVRAGTPVGAYELLYRHQQEIGHHIAPNTIYRALIFLERHGLVAHLAHQRRYVALAPQSDRCVMFFSCKACGNSVECDATQIVRVLSAAADALAFRAVSCPLEVTGICRSCAADAV